MWTSKLVIPMVICLVWCVRLSAQEKNLAERQLIGLIECINENSPEKRLDFLKSEFAEEDDRSLEQRIEIAKQIHARFSPLTLNKVIKSEKISAVADFNTNQGVILRWTLTLSQNNLIDEISTEPITEPTDLKLPSGTFPINRGDNEQEPKEAFGIWRAKGYGFVIRINENGFALFHQTENYFWPDELDDQLYFVQGDTDDEAEITFFPGEPGYNVVRLDKLPEDFDKQPDWTQSKCFDLFVDIFRQHYPFFELRNVDWEQRAKNIRKSVNDEMTDSELFDAMQAMIKDLDDGHVYLEATIEGKTKLARTGGTSILTRLRKAFKPTEEIKTYQRFFSTWRDQLFTSIKEKTLGGKAKVSGNDKIIWGRVHKDVGYLFITGMGEYAFGDTAAQLKGLHDAMDEILTELSDTRALIIDISFNGGGSDIFSLHLASHFADQKRLGFSKWPSSEEQYRRDFYFEPYTNKNANGVMYNKPIVLVTNDVTASAAEIFTMCMRSIPQVTTVGIPTEGALSDILPKRLPNGWELGLSNEIYVDHTGKCHEGPGIPPAVRLDIFDPSDITQIGHAESMKKVLDIALDWANKQ